MRRLAGLNLVMTIGLIAALLFVPASAALAHDGPVASASFVWSPPAVLPPSAALAQDGIVTSASFVWSPPFAPPQSPTAQTGATTHVVARGENLYRISLRYGVSVNALLRANGMTNPHKVYAGQRLVIPNRPGTTPPVPAPAPQPVPAPGPQPGPGSGSGKEIVVVLHEQKVYAYENGEMVHSTLASTGVASYPTPVGSYKIYVKYLSTLMTGPGYYLPNVPYVMYFIASYGLHGTYWHNNFGHPMSHGCVNLPTSEAKWFFEWAPVGTPVTVRS